MMSLVGIFYFVILMKPTTKDLKSKVPYAKLKNPALSKSKTL